MKIILTSLLFLISTLLVGQTADNTLRLNETNIYYQGLEQYLNYIKSDRSAKIDTIYIEEDFRITDSLLLLIGETQIIKLTFDKVAQFLKSKKRVTLYRIFPLRYENGEFSISFVPFTVSKSNKKTINYVNQGGNRVIFKFDKEKFYFTRVE